MLNWSSLIPSFILILLVSVSGWFAVKNTELPLQSAGFAQTGTLYAATLLAFDEKGAPQYQLLLKSARQYDNTHIDLAGLSLTSYSSDTPILVTATEGLIDNTRHDVTLKGNVIIHRPAKGKINGATFSTDSLTLYPQTKTAYTASEVSAKEDNSHNTTVAKGLSASLNPRKINLLKDVKSVFYPK